MPLEEAGMTRAIEEAFEKEWDKRKKIPLPDAGSEDRQLLFAAIARGILEYLVEHENEVIKSIRIRWSPQEVGTYTVEQVDLDISISA
jgi:hypothetical protein